MDHPCYCCTKPSTSAMDIDAALSELGMLSSVTDSRQQYIRERRRRGAVVGQACTLPKSSSAVGLYSHLVKEAPPSSCNGYQILTMNTAFITGVSTDSATPSPKLDQNITQGPYQIGIKYQSDSVEASARSARNARTKLSRLRRFKKPYEVPWRQQSCGGQIETAILPSISTSLLVSTPDRPVQSETCNSNSSTPEKSSHTALKQGTMVPRSRSLDDLNKFEKLNLTENGNHSFLAETREIDNMSTHMKNLTM